MTNPYENNIKHQVEGTAPEILGTRAAYTHGARGRAPTFQRFVVLETIFDPTTIDDKKAEYYRYVLGLADDSFIQTLPRNTLIGKKVAEGVTKGGDKGATLLFPFFPPNISMPCQPGEHVWVMFEHPIEKHSNIGYWFCRIVEAGFVDDVNHTHAPRALDPTFSKPGGKDLVEGKTQPVYEFRNGRPETIEGERFSNVDSMQLPNEGDDAYEKLMTKTEGGKLMKYEPVPRYRKRPGELALEGTNNSLIVLGRDRTGAVAKYETDQVKGEKVAVGYPDDDVSIDTPGAGSIDLVVGRGQTKKTSGKTVESKTVKDPTPFQKELDKSLGAVVEGEGDPDFKNDRSRILISQLTKPDTNFGLSSVIDSHATMGPSITDKAPGSGAIVIKSDKLRLVARQDVVIIVASSDLPPEKDENGRIKDIDLTPDKCASIIIKSKDRKSTRLNSSHVSESRMPSSA